MAEPFEQQQEAASRRAYRLACSLGAALFLLGVTLDAASQPQALGKLLAIRLTTSAAFFALYLAARAGRIPFGRAFPAGICILFLASASITGMCLVLDGYQSPYYAGINLVVLAAGLLFPWNPRQLGIGVAVIVGTYLTAVLAQANLHIPRVDLLANNMYFLSCTSIIAVSSAWLADRLRRESFAHLTATEAAQAKLQEQDQLKTQFFTNVSHELRTPLTLILAPVATQLARPELDAEARHSLTMIQNNARTLLKHVDDLLDVARLEADRLHPAYQSIDLARLVRRVASQFELRAAERDIAFTVATPPELPAELDPAQLGRVLMNLLSNAFKFTPAGGRIRCTLTASEVAHVEVADSGPGIPEHLRQRVFERFFQVEESTRRKHGGTGLGLAITHELVALHHGSIAVAVAPEGGALFSVSLPLRAPPGTELATASEVALPVEPPPPAAAPAPPTTPLLDGADLRPLVLVVEDHPEMRELIAGVLAADLRVATAVDGRDGLAKTLALHPDLVVSDVMMPEMSGGDLLRAIRARPELEHLPFVMLTARAEEQLRVELLQAGAQDFLLKPFSPEELRARVSGLVRVKRALGALQLALDTRHNNIESASGEIVRALKLRDEFLSLASHELRTPITSLTFQLEIARRKLSRQQLDETEQIKLIDFVAHQVSRLARLIDTMLDVSRIRSGHFGIRRARFDLAALARDVAEKLVAEARIKGSELKVCVDGPIEGEWDRDRLEQVIVNLLTNAIKYGAGQRIELSAERRGEGAVLRVRDHGIGIAREHQARIFERFERATPLENASGLGLGLYITRQIVMAHGGEISVESEPQHGSIFTVRLPANRRVASEPMIH